jgi:beta-galactosidase
MTSHNPSLLLAHHRFASEQVISGLAEQYDVIRKGSPGRDITTNVYSGDLDIDPRSLADLGGIYAIDSYPHGVDGPHDVGLTLDRRPAGRQTRVWVMEQQIGPINWTSINPPVPPGQVRAWIWQAALHGVEAMFFFRWRAALGGQEQFHSELLRHDATPTDALGEVAAAIKEVRNLEAKGQRKAAILFSHEDGWLVDIHPHRQGLTHRSLVLAVYIACRAVGLEVAVVDPADDLTGYSIVLAPCMQMTTTNRVGALKSALAAGALVILGPRSLIMDEEGVFVDTAIPAGLFHQLGGRLVEQLSQALDLTVEPWAASAGPWTDVLEEGRADVIARYGGSDHLNGRAAAIRRSNLVYAGFSSAEAWTAMLAGLLDIEKVPPNIDSFPSNAIQIDHTTHQITAT